MFEEVLSRDISRGVERELWARAAGRCQFNGCNQPVYKSPLTQQRVNISEKAHIYSFSKKGPRGRGPLARDKKRLNEITNLLLVCHGCHKTIDQRCATRYPASLLSKWKIQHETRIRVVTGISPSRRSHVILYEGKIGEENSPLDGDVAVEAMFPDWYPASEEPITLSMQWEHEDTADLFWQAEATHLRAAFEQRIRPLIKGANPIHFSIFARANQPLLVLLGSLFTDKVPAEVYQLHREPVSWRWGDYPDTFSFRVNRPDRPQGEPALVISLSGKIHHDRVTSVLGTNYSIWELTIDECRNDFLRSRIQLSVFRETIRKLIVEISEQHGQATPLSIFPAMPVACAVELGRIRMPKADMPWIVFDQNNKLAKFVKALEIGERHE